MKEIKIDKKILYDLYINKNMNIIDVAKKTNISQSAIAKKLKKYGIKKARKIIIENTKRTNIAKRGEDYAKVSKATLEKRKITNKKKYGVDNPMKNERIKQKAIRKMRENNKNLKKREEAIRKRENTCLKKYGVRNVSKLKEVQKKKEQTCLKNNGVDNIFKSEKFVENNKNNYYKKIGVKNPAQSLEVRKKMVKNSKNSKSNIDGSRFDSAYERDFYDYCLRNEIKVEGKQIPIEYEYEKKKHITFIDFKVNGNLIECKGGHLLQGIFDYALGVPIKEKLKIYEKYNVTIITDKKGIEILKKCPINLTVKDIDIFK